MTTHESPVRASIENELSMLKITATGAAKSAIEEACASTPSEIAGDTDSILLGLIRTGSYATDILQQSGISTKYLSDLLQDSMSSSMLGNHSDPVRSYFYDFKSTVTPYMQGGRNLEAAHLLASAISPRHSKGNSLPAKASGELADFPYHLRQDKQCGGDLRKQLEGSAVDIMVYFCSFLNIARIREMLKHRTSPLTSQEDRDLDKQLGTYHIDMEDEELEFGINALNTWFTKRMILTDPSDLCLRTAGRCMPMLFGPESFASAGGDLKSVDTALELARKYSPERDLPAIGMFSIDGQIRFGEYTYRNHFAAEGPRTLDDLHRVSISALRPVPLIHSSTINEFENLINQEGVAERHIQHFLNCHPEILISLGYSGAHPHLVLTESGHEDMIPDYFLEIPGRKQCDIIDLKLPNVRLIVKNPYLNLSAHLTKAVGQLKAYHDFFDKAYNRTNFHSKYGLEAYRPTLMVAIGRRNEFSNSLDRKTIEERLSGIRLFTYDDLFDYAKVRSTAPSLQLPTFQTST